jgi:hypothetical protein
MSLSANEDEIEMGRRSNNSDSRHALSSHEASQPLNNPIPHLRESQC